MPAGTRAPCATPAGFAAASAALLVAAFVIRLVRIGHEALWFDEAASMRLVESTLGEVLRRSAADSTPALYFLGLHAWGAVVPDTDGWLRAYSLLWSMAGLAVLAGFVRRIAGPRAALAALALATVNPQDVYFAQELRMYAMIVTLCTAATWCLWEWLEARGAHATTRRTRVLWAGYAALAACLVTTHYVALAVLLAHATWVAARCARRRDPRTAAWFVAAGAAAVLLAAPWFAFVLWSAGGLNRANVAWMTLPPAAHHWNFLWREFVWGHVAWAQDHLLPAGLAAAALCALCAAWALWRAPASAVPLLAMTALPVAWVAVLSRAAQPVYARDRFSLLVLPPFLALVATGLSRMRPRAALVVGCAVAAAMLSGTVFQHRAVKRTDWHAFARAWHEHGPPDHVAHFPAYNALPADRALGARAGSITRAQLEEALAAGRLEGRTVWLVHVPGHEFAAHPGEAELRARVLALGGARSVPVPARLVVTAVRVGDFAPPDEFRTRFARWHEPEDAPGRVAGFSDRARFHAVETDTEGRPVRWSQPTAWVTLLGIDDGPATAVVRYELPPRALAEGAWRPELEFTARRAQPADDATSTVRLRVPDDATGPQTAVLPVPDGGGPLHVGWRMNGVRPPADARTLGIQVRWVGIEAPAAP